MVVILAVSFLSLLLGNAVLARSARALRATYASHVSGHLSVAARTESTFTIFGSSQLLVGEYLVPETILEYPKLEEFARSLPRVRSTAGLVSALARVSAGGRSHEQTVFGVDFAEYQRMFPSLELTRGRFPEPGERGVVLQEATGWPADIVGEEALLAVARETSFTLREVPVRGMFRYPVDDELLSTVALADPDTARALNGYIYGAADEAEIPEEQQELLDSEMDSMFGGRDGAAGAGKASDPASATDPEALLEQLRDRREADQARRTVEGAWNFLLISTQEPGQADAVMRRLRRAGFGEDEGYLVRDWRDTVGGNARIVSYLQLLFNAGLLFVAFGAAIITTNALVLSVLERTREIGTFRALGASRARVGTLIAAETVIVVVGSALAGLALGALATRVLNGAGLVIDNRYIELLFGGGPVAGRVDAGLILSHLAAAGVLSVVALVYPLKRALGISPVEAMAE